jgi:rhamnulokinase
MRKEVNAAAGKNLTLGEQAYCIFHSLAIGYAKAIKELESLTGETYQTLNIIGGGTKNQLLNELTEEAMGIRIVIGASEATAIGNLAIQMISEGVFADLSEAKQVIKNSI